MLDNKHRYFMIKIKNGDQQALMDYIIYWNSFIENVVNKLNVNDNIKEDLNQAGIEGVLIGISTFNLDSENRIYIYIRRKIIENLVYCLGNYLDFFKKGASNIIKYGNYIDNLIKYIQYVEFVEKKYNTFEKEEIVDILFESVVEQEFYDAIRAFLLTLPNEDKNLFYDYNGLVNNKESCQNLAKKYGVCHQNISQKADRLAKKLNNEYVFKALMNENIQFELDSSVYLFYKKYFFNISYSYDILKDILSDNEINIFFKSTCDMLVYKSKIIFSIFAKVIKWQYGFEKISDILEDFDAEYYLTASEILFYKNIKNVNLLELIKCSKCEYIFGYLLPRLYKLKEKNNSKMLIKNK